MRNKNKKNQSIQQTIYIISQFMGSRHSYNVFHFLGYYRGHKIRKVYVVGGVFELGEDYMVKINVSEICEHELYGNYLNSKKI